MNKNLENPIKCRNFVVYKKMKRIYKDNKRI